MNELSLFTGAGGGILGTSLLGFRPIGYVEWDDYCQRVLAQRIKDGILHNAPIFGNIQTFISDGYAASYAGLVDLLTAGFPCQPFSAAGKQRGEADERNMWPATADVIRIVQPRCVLLENVPGIRQYLPVVLRDLRRLGYQVRRPLILGADDVGAPHRRKRVWIYAQTVTLNSHTDSIRLHRTESNPTRQGSEIQSTNKQGRVVGQICEAVADSQGSQSGQPSEWQGWKDIGGGSEEVHDMAHAFGVIEDNKKEWRPLRFSVWEREPLETLRDARKRGREEDGLPVPESLLGRVADGVAHRVDRLKALGNGQVPQVVAAAWRLLTHG